MYLLVKPDGTVYGRRETPNERTVHFETNQPDEFFRQNVGRLKLSNGHLYLVEFPDLTSVKAEQLEIMRWFSEHDYYVNKIVTGEWQSDDTRWTSYLSERNSKRARLDEIESTIMNATETLTLVE